MESIVSLSKKNTINFVLIVFLCSIILAISAIVILGPSITQSSDALTYLKTMTILDSHESGVSMAYRILTTSGALWVVIALSKIFGTYESAWMFMNLVLYLGITLFFYELVRQLQDSKKVAWLSAMFLAGNYAMITYALGYFMDVGGWFFFVASALAMLLYAKTSNTKYIWLSGLAVGVGGLFKEYAYLGAFIIGFYLLYENWRTPLTFVKKVLPPALITVVPLVIVHATVYLKYRYTYLTWLELNQETYVYASKIIEYIKTFGSLLNVLGLLSIIGLIYFLKSRNEPQANPTESNTSWAFVVCFFLAICMSFLWPAITQRIQFIFVPIAIVLASYFIKRFESHWYLFLPILAVYLVINFLMDSFLLNFVNLPF